jgi:hypothetical protein
VFVGVLFVIHLIVLFVTLKVPQAGASLEFSQRLGFFAAYFLSLVVSTLLWCFPFGTWITKSIRRGWGLSLGAVALTFFLFTPFTLFRVLGWTESHLLLSLGVLAGWTVVMTFVLARNLNLWGILESDAYWVWILFSPGLALVSVMTALFPMPILLALFSA